MESVGAESETALNVLTVLIMTVIATGAAAAAAVANWLALDKSTRQTEASIFLALRERYASDEMRGHISALAEFAWDIQDDAQAILTRFADLKRGGGNAYADLEGAVRRVAAFFDDVGTLRRHRLISERLAHALADTPGINVYYKVSLRILTSRKQPNDSTALSAQTLKELLPIYADGKISKPYGSDQIIGSAHSSV